jgi:hypothetical protein
MAKGRYAVLPLAPQNGYTQYVIYDCRSGRIVDGVYMRAEMALGAARVANQTDGKIWATDMTPSAEALGLLYPNEHDEEDGD